jgi:hypothetical protein
MPAGPFAVRKETSFSLILFVIVTPHHDLSGRNSVVECHLAKVDVDGSNPFARSIYLSSAAA